MGTPKVRRAGVCTAAPRSSPSSSGLALTAASALLAAELGRRRVLPYRLGVVLAAGAATTFYLTPVLPVPGIAWLVLGAYLVRAGPSEVRF